MFLVGGEGDGDDTMMDVLAAPEVDDSSFSPLDQSLLCESVEEALTLLDDPRQKKILERRFGLDGGEPETLDQVKLHMGVTRERVRQIQTKALRKLESEPAGKKLRRFLKS